jgi:hypothetical protein
VWESTNLKGILHKKHRFPVKSDTLFSFLDKYSVTQITTISYDLRTSRDTLISARYKGEFHKDRIAYFNASGFYRSILKNTGYSEIPVPADICQSKICLYSVRPEDEEIARNVLLEDGLPLLCEWLVEAEQQTYNWKRIDHSIVFKFKKQQLSCTLDETGWW